MVSCQLVLIPVYSSNSRNKLVIIPVRKYEISPISHERFRKFEHVSPNSISSISLVRFPFPRILDSKRETGIGTNEIGLMIKTEIGLMEIELILF